MNTLVRKHLPQLLLLILCESAWPCSYTQESSFELQDAISSSSEIIIANFRTAEGPIWYEDQQSGLVVRTPNRVLVEVEHVLKGNLERGPLWLSPGPFYMCQDADEGFYHSAQEDVQQGIDFTLLLMLNELEADTLVVTPFRPWTLRLMNDFNFDNSPFINFIKYTIENEVYPIQVTVTGQPLINNAQAMPVRVDVSNGLDEPVGVLFPGEPRRVGSFGGSFAPYKPLGTTLWMGVSDESETCPECYSSFLQPIRIGEPTIETTIFADLCDLYDLSEPDTFALEGYIRLPISPGQNYYEFWSKFLRFEVSPSTSVHGASWGGIKEGR